MSVRLIEFVHDICALLLRNQSCRKISSTMYPGSGAGNVSEPRLLLQVGRLSEFVYGCRNMFPAFRAAEVPVLVCLRSSCSHVTDVSVRFVTLALNAVVQNDGDFMDLILLYTNNRRPSRFALSIFKHLAINLYLSMSRP